MKERNSVNSCRMIRVVTAIVLALQPGLLLAETQSSESRSGASDAEILAQTESAIRDAIRRAEEAAKPENIKSLIGRSRSWVNDRAPAPGDYARDYVYQLAGDVAFDALAVAAAIRSYNSIARNTTWFGGWRRQAPTSDLPSSRTPIALRIANAGVFSIFRIVAMGTALVAIADSANGVYAFVVDGERVAPFAVWRAAYGYATGAEVMKAQTMSDTAAKTIASELVRRNAASHEIQQSKPAIVFDASRSDAAASGTDAQNAQDSIGIQPNVDLSLEPMPN